MGKFHYEMSVNKKYSNVAGFEWMLCMNKDDIFGQILIERAELDFIKNSSLSCEEEFCVVRNFSIDLRSQVSTMIFVLKLIF